MALKLKRALLGIVLSLIVIMSFAVMTEQQKELSRNLKTGSAFDASLSFNVLQAMSIDQIGCLILPASAHVSMKSTHEPAFNVTREEIYSYIVANPGMQFRGLCNAMGLSVGLVQYHLGVLVKSGFVSFVRDGRYKRYFQAKKFSKKEIHIISLLRHKTVNSIFKALLDKKQMTHNKLASQVLITSQALSWQMRWLSNTGFILEIHEGVKTKYLINKTSLAVLQKCMLLIET